MTWPGIELPSPRPLMNTLLIRPKGPFLKIIKISIFLVIDFEYWRWEKWRNIFWNIIQVHFKMACHSMRRDGAILIKTHEIHFIYLSDKIKWEFFQALALSVQLYDCTARSLCGHWIARESRDSQHKCFLFPSPDFHQCKVLTIIQLKIYHQFIDLCC